MEGQDHSAVCLTELVGKVSVDDSVLLNTIAVSLSLGTGGNDFVIANLTHPVQEEAKCPGHIIKLRYTPMQTSVFSAEEDDSPHRGAILGFRTLEEMPVIAGELHSQLAPVCGAIKSIIPDARIAYIMTDAAALPLAFSRIVTFLKEKGLLDTTITCGQAFGGDLEAVTLQSALAAAKEVAGADVTIVLQGPGNAGTGTQYGFGGIEQGEVINAVYSLGGRPIAIPRISFADPRERHRGVSHHTVTALGKIALAPCTIPVPILTPNKQEIVMDALEPLREKHQILILDADETLTELETAKLPMRTMGRNSEEDREFFLACVSAGLLAVKMLQEKAV